MTRAAIRSRALSLRKTREDFSMKQSKVQRDLVSIMRTYCETNRTSIRSLALEIEVSPALLNQILKGTRPIPADAAEKIIKWADS